MSWLQKLLPPKIKRDVGAPKKVVPEGLWSKCDACEAVLYRTDIEKNLFVCPKCGHHDRLSARDRLDPGELPLVDLGPAQLLGHARQHLHHADVFQDLVGRAVFTQSQSGM